MEKYILYITKLQGLSIFDVNALVYAFSYCMLSGLSHVGNPKMCGRMPWIKVCVCVCVHVFVLCVCLCVHVCVCVCVASVYIFVCNVM